MKLQLKRSNVLESGSAKEPTAAQLEYGELAINYNTDDPAIFLKDSNNNVIRISGVNNIADDGQVELPESSTPPANPLPGNLWFNSEDGRLYIYYKDPDTEQWVDASPDSWDPTSYPNLADDTAQGGTLDDRYLMLNTANNPVTGAVNINNRITLSTDGSGDFDENVTANRFIGPVTGDVTGNVTGNITGNADTATRATDADNADRLGNELPAFYRNASNINAGTISNDRLPATITSEIIGTASNAAKLDGQVRTDAATADTVVNRNGSADINVRLLRSTYQNQNTISGGMVYRINDGADNFFRICNDTGAIRTFLNVPTRTGGNASGTWGINITGSAGSSGSSTNATNATNCRIDHDTGNAWHRIVMIDDGKGSGTNQRLKTDNGSTVAINPSSNQVRASTFVGNLSGNASTASSATNAGKLDNIDSSQFVRSDVDDIKTGGYLRFNDNIRCDFGSSNDFRMFCNGSHMYMDLQSGIGNLYIRDGSSTRFTFDDNGTFTATSNITAYSDVTLKENIETIPNALDKVLALRGVSFNRIDQEEKPRQLGVIAQEVEEIVPEVVITGEEGIKSVAYGNLVGLLIESIKDLKAEVDDLKAQLEG